MCGIIGYVGHRASKPLLLCAAVDGRTLAEAATIMPKFPQVKENVPVSRKELTDTIRAEVERVNAELGTSGRVLVRPSGTEPVVRVLAEAESEEGATALCGSIAALVRRELG